LMAIVGPFIYTGLFYKFSSDQAPLYFPGAPFMAAAAILTLASIIAFVSIRNMKQSVLIKPDLQEDELLDKIVVKGLD
jgi:MFS transporter, DHA1 family, tetracycline resistance protein